MTCREFENIASAPDPSEQPRLRAHLSECAECGQEWAAIEAMRMQVRELDLGAPTAEQVQQVRGGVLFAMRSRRPAIPLARAAAILLVVLLAGSGLAALGGRLLLARPTPAAIESKPVVVRPVEPRQVRSPVPEMPPIVQNESPRVEPAAPKPVARSRRATPAPGPRSETLPSHHASEAEVEFGQAWAYLKQGRYPEAAAGFQRTRVVQGGGALAEDADYWRAVALARHGKVESALAALSSFLQVWPQSPRTLEVSAMLGWFHVENGNCGLATPLFLQAGQSSRPDVRKSARAGLDACR
jgi:tetratricopeptide (TPR) repeat protein